MIANRMAAESASGGTCPFIDAAEAPAYSKYRFRAVYTWVALHELFGHGTGRMMIEESEGKYNFDINNPPIDPLTGNPIKSWYRHGQTWTGQFGDLATTVDECRADLVGAYLMADAELLALFEFGNDNEVLLQECMRYFVRILKLFANTTTVTYYFYLLLGVHGLRALSNYNADSNVSQQSLISRLRTTPDKHRCSDGAKPTAGYKSPPNDPLAGFESYL